MSWDKPTRPTIFTNPDFLSEAYLPEDIMTRERLGREIASLLNALIENRKPINCWFHGKPGAGKTATAKWILRRIAKESNVRGVYVNCWENPTFFSVLECIARETRMLGAEKLSTSFKLARLKRHLAGSGTLIVLDEIDQPSPKERNSILYNLSDLPSAAIICVCNSQNVYFDLEDRVKSRLNPERLFFEEYSPEELLRILTIRAEYGLAPGACSDDVLRMAAGLSQGDARIAIQTLKNAVLLAEKGSRPRIADEDVHRAWHAAKDLKRTFLLRKLTDHHRLLYETVAKSPGILSGDLWQLYLKTCSSKAIEPIAVRTFSDYCNTLAELGLVHAKRAAIKGKVRSFSIIQ